MAVADPLLVFQQSEGVPVIEMLRGLGAVILAVNIVLFGNIQSKLKSMKKVVVVMSLLNLCSVPLNVILYKIFTKLVESMTMFKRLLVFVISICIFAYIWGLALNCTSLKSFYIASWMYNTID